MQPAITSTNSSKQNFKLFPTIVWRGSLTNLRSLNEQIMWSLRLPPNKSWNLAKTIVSKRERMKPWTVVSYLAGSMAHHRLWLARSTRNKPPLATFSRLYEGPKNKDQWSIIIVELEQFPHHTLKRKQRIIGKKTKLKMGLKVC